MALDIDPRTMLTGGREDVLADDVATGPHVVSQVDDPFGDFEAQQLSCGAPSFT